MSVKHRKALGYRRWAATTWLGLFLMLFNIANVTTMGLRPAGAMPNGEMALCAEHHSHHQDPSKPASDSCSCCLSMCCAGAAVPDSVAPAPVPGMAWVALSFSTTASFRLHPAPRTGGSARAPPSFA